MIVNPPQNGCTRVIITPTSDQDFYKWTGILLLWSNLKTEGLEYKISVPSLDFFPGEENLLVCHFKVYFPQMKPQKQQQQQPRKVSSAGGLFSKSSKSLNNSNNNNTNNSGVPSPLPSSPSSFYSDNTQRKPESSPIVSEGSTENVNGSGNEDQPSSPFQINVQWQPVVGVLNQAGVLELLNESDGSLILSMNLQQILSSRVRQIDYSLFDSSRILYVQPSEGVVSSSFSNNKARPASDYYFYAYFGSQIDYDDWVSTLKSFTRKRIFSPTSLNISKSLRITRKINLRVIECKYEKHSPRTNTNISNSPFNNSYVEVEFEKLVWARTFVAYNQKRPFWRDDFLFEDFPVRPPNLKLVVKNRLSNSTTQHTPPPQHNKLINPKYDPVVGYVHISALDLKESENVEKWYPLIPAKDHKEAEYCSICVKINYEEIDILASEHYERVRQILTGGDLGNKNLTTQIADRVRDLTQLSDILLNLYQAENRCVEWIGSLVGGEISKLKDSITHAPVYNSADFKFELDNTLFRGNSLVSKVLERYMKLAGKEYLDRVIGDFVRKAMDNNLAIEIDPGRIPPSSSVSGKPPDLIAEINHRRLARYVNQLWSSIRDTSDELPYSFKVIFKRLRNDLALNLHQDEPVIFNAVSGFLFLRFFCPALLNPKLFGLVRCHPNSYVQRSFTLIAKMLQGFANRVRFGLKEPWMVPMNSFIDSHEGEMLSYYREVTLMNTQASSSEVSSGFTTQQYDRPVKEQPVPSIMGETPSNPFLIDRYENYAKLVKLWTDSESIREDSAISADGMYQSDEEEEDEGDEENNNEENGEGVGEENTGNVLKLQTPPQLSRPHSSASSNTSSRFEETVMNVLDERNVKRETLTSIAPKRVSSLKQKPASTDKKPIAVATTNSSGKKAQHRKKNTLTRIQEEAFDAFELEMIAIQHRLNSIKGNLLGPEMIPVEDIDDLIAYTFVTYNSETGHITHSKYAVAVAQAASQQQQFTGSPKPSKSNKISTADVSPINTPSSPASATTTPTSPRINNNSTMTPSASSPFLNQTWGSSLENEHADNGLNIDDNDEDKLSAKSGGGRRIAKWMKFKKSSRQ